MPARGQAPPPAWAAAEEDRRPFFMVVLTQQSHHDYRVPAGWRRTDFGTGEADLEAYFNALRYTDGFLEELVASFQREPTIDEPIYVFVGDHGQAFGEHGYQFHGHHVWEEVINVPFIIYDPLAPRSESRIEGQYQLVDLIPTVADLLGLRLTGDYGGARSVFDGTGRRKIYVPASASQAMALLTDSLKFVYTYRREPLRAFDLRIDREEQEDVSTRLSVSDRARIELELLTWRQRTDQAFHAAVVAIE